MDKLKANNTNMFHVYFSIASACLAWIFFVKPLTTIGPNKSLYYMIGGVIVWCILLPIIMIATESIYNSISGEDSFVLVKIFSLIVAVIIIQGFIAGNYYYKFKNFKLMTIVINIILIINIAEACYSQMYNYITEENQNKVYNLINPIIGALLIPVLIINIIKGQGMRVIKSGSSINLFSDLKPWFILAYSFWNLLFRVHLLPNTSTMLFFVVSIVLPIIADFAKWGDWLQIRAITLLFVMIVMFGITPGEGNIMPIYDTDGYDKIIDDNNSISKLQRNDTFKYTLLILGGLTLLLSFRESWTQKNFLK